MKEKMRERKSEVIYEGKWSTVIPPEIIFMGYIISHGAFRTWCAIRYFARRPDQKDRESFPGYERLSKMIGVSEQQTRKYIRELEDVGLIVTTRKQSKIYYGTFNVYRMIDPEKWLNEIGKKLKKGGQEFVKKFKKEQREIRTKNP